MENKVELLGYYGGDKTHCNSAWQSTNLELNIELSEDVNKRNEQIFEATKKKKKKSSLELLKMLAEAGHHCYDDETQILTLEGWKYFDSLTEQDKVCAVDIDTKECWFETPKQVYSNYYNEPMYYVKSPEIDLAVTKGHRMVVSQERLSADYGKHWEFQTTDIVQGQSRKYLKSAQIKNDQQFSDTFAKLLGFFMGEGHYTSKDIIVFNLKLQRKIEFLYSLGYKVENPGTHKYVIKDFNLDFDFNLCYSETREKKLPQDILKYSKQDVENILIGLKNSGNSNPSIDDKEWFYYTPSTILKEQLLTISCLHNFVFTESGSFKGDFADYKLLHRLKYSEIVDPEISSPKKIGEDCWKYYSGRVYCVTVSTGAVIVKRNNKIVVSGNTPFEKSSLHFQVTGDIASHIHIIKHRIGTSVNSECLTGDTVITLSEQQGLGYTKVDMSISELYKEWVEKKKEKEKEKDYIQTLLQTKSLKGLNEEKGYFKVGYIKDVWEAGIKDVYQITLEKGIKIKCTSNHGVYTKEGFKTINTGLRIGDLVAWTTSERWGKFCTYETSAIESIIPFGKEMTYDIEVEGIVNNNFVANGIVVHNSARYKELKDKWYLPEDWRDVKVKTSKDCTDIAKYFLDKSTNWYQVLEEFNQLGNELYHLSCDDLTEVLGRVRAKESARYFLSYSKQLDFDVMFNFRSFMHFQSLRNSPNAQKEIKQIAQRMLYLVKSIPNNPFEQSLKAFKV